MGDQRTCHASSVETMQATMHTRAHILIITAIALPIPIEYHNFDIFCFGIVSAYNYNTYIFYIVRCGITVAGACTWRPITRQQ